MHSTDDPAEGDLLLAARRMALPALRAGGQRVLIDDVAVPRSRIADVPRRLRRHRRAARRSPSASSGTPVTATCTRPSCFDRADADQRDRAYGAFDDILELGLSLGGTITGEHGVGVIKVDWLEREIGPVALDVHRAIKDALDPAGLLNPGKVFRAPPPTCGRRRPRLSRPTDARPRG